MMRFTRHYSVATHFPRALTVVYGKYVKSIHAKRFYLRKKPCTIGKSMELKVSEPIFSFFLLLLLLVCRVISSFLCRVCNFWVWMESWDATFRMKRLHKDFHSSILFSFYWTKYVLRGSGKNAVKRDPRKPPNCCAVCLSLVSISYAIYTCTYTYSNRVRLIVITRWRNLALFANVKFAL